MVHLLGEICGPNKLNERPSSIRLLTPAQCFLCHLKTLGVENGPLQRRETSSCASFLGVSMLGGTYLMFYRELVSTLKLMPAGPNEWFF